MEHIRGDAGYCKGVIKLQKNVTVIIKEAGEKQE
jgi:hypothetical protein